jgi:hypothetical protein
LVFSIPLLLPLPLLLLLLLWFTAGAAMMWWPLQQLALHSQWGWTSALTPLRLQMHSGTSS